MKYTSKCVKEILTSPSAKKGLDYITPIYQQAYTALWLMQAIGVQTDIFLQWIEEYRQQILPQTATWALPYYEQEYGIITNSALSLEERRRAVISAVRTRAPMNPQKLETILGMTAGYPIKITENTGKNTFSICALDTGAESFKKKVTLLLDTIKPAHLIYKLSVQPPPFIFVNTEKMFLERIIFAFRSLNLATEKILLNGKKNLDGTWILQLLFQKGIAMYHIHFYLHHKEAIKTHLFRQIYFYDGQNKNQAIQNKYYFLFSQQNEQKVEFPLLKQKLSVKNKNTAKTSIIINKLYYLNGAVLCNGKRKLNADKIRSEF